MVSEKIDQTVRFLQNKTGISPQVGLILGSGLGDLADTIRGGVGVPYGEIPHFPLPTVAGHRGRLVVGELAGKKVMAMQGRFHFYEGYGMEQVTYPVRVMSSLGVETIIVTNAAGGINTKFVPGDLMLIADQINLMGTNPLIGPNDDETGPRFPDMSDAYSGVLREKVKSIAAGQGLSLREGVYAAVSGPSYETPAEIRYLRVIGADAVGMSTAPEVITANQAGMKVIGISCITNMAAGVLDRRLDHREVMETASRVRVKFGALILAVVEAL